MFLDRTEASVVRTVSGRKGGRALISLAHRPAPTAKKIRPSYLSDRQQAPGQVLDSSQQAASSSRLTLKNRWSRLKGMFINPKALRRGRAVAVTVTTNAGVCSKVMVSPAAPWLF